jgi:hypothetical protein
MTQVVAEMLATQPVLIWPAGLWLAFEPLAETDRCAALAQPCKAACTQGCHPGRFQGHGPITDNVRQRPGDLWERLIAPRCAERRLDGGRLPRLSLGACCLRDATLCCPLLLSGSVRLQRLIAEPASDARAASRSRTGPVFVPLSTRARVSQEAVVGSLRHQGNDSLRGRTERRPRTLRRARHGARTFPDVLI